jgi:hypothetical protein
VFLCEAADETVLNQIVGGHLVSGKSSSVATQARDLCFDFLVIIIHGQFSDLLMIEA